MKSNIIYVLYHTFAIDLLFWIVVNNLFLTSVKGMTSFDIILITLLGLAFSIVLYPLINLINKKLSNHVSIIIGACCLIVSILLFTFCRTIYGFVIAETLHLVSSLFRQSATVMLKNNLHLQGKDEQFVKWKSLGQLGYSIITMVIAIVAGIFFNINPYLPMYLCLAFTIVGLIFAILYNEPKVEKQDTPPQAKLKTVLKRKIIILIFFMNLFGVGTYSFFLTKTTLLLQTVCENGGMELAKISLIVSGVVLASRILRVLSNFLMPIIYKKTKKKNNLLISIGVAIILAALSLALGGNLPTNIIVNIVLITLGLLIAISIRDLYSTLENKMVVSNLPESEQRQALMLGNIFGNFGRLLLNGVTLLILGLTTLNNVYLYLLIFAVAQIFVVIPLSKYLDTDTNQVSEK